MTLNRRLVAFAASTDLPRSEAFYVDVLGLKVVDRNPFAIQLDGGGTQLRITAVDKHRAVAYTVLGWEVDDIESSVDELVERGGIPILYDGMEQDTRGIWTAPERVRVVWFRDPDGNVLSFQSRL